MIKLLRTAKIYEKLFTESYYNLPLQTLRGICTSQRLDTFWESSRKGGYNTEIKLSWKEHVRNGLKELKNEIKIWLGEIRETFRGDPIIINRPGEVDFVWKFGSQQALDTWVTTADSDHNEGYSSCSLSLTKYGHGLFSGQLDTKVPQDGKTKKAGYCSMKTKRARKSFKRETYLDWSMYNILVLKIRGDGRAYMLNLATTGFYDVLWNDIYHYPLYTRGGPYWQTTRIPFSKFFLSSKGRIQDKQCEIPLHRIVSLGITVADKVNGLFQLEIDYIGLDCDPNHTEQFAYEMYKLPKYIAAT